MTYCFNIYVGNHGKEAGIEDYLELLSDVLGSRGCKAEISNRLRADIPNIIIDEFTNYIENRKLSEYKRLNPSCLCIYVLTEFCERRYFVRTLNHFHGLVDSAALALLTVMLKTSRDDFDNVSFVDALKLIIHLPFLAANFLYLLASYGFATIKKRRLSSFASYVARKQHRLAYFHMRFLGLSAHLRYADAVITSHEAIAAGMADLLPYGLAISGVVYPEFNEDGVVRNLMSGKKLFVEITGSVTKYRRTYIESLNNFVRLLGIQHTFGWAQAIPFASLQSGKSMERGAYSFHPPQSKDWPYSSPTRIYRALQVEHNLPVLTSYFGQNPIEDVCLIFKGSKTILEMAEMFSDRQRLLAFIEPRVKRYNQIARERNDKLVTSLIELTQKDKHAPIA